MKSAPKVSERPRPNGNCARDVCLGSHLRECKESSAMPSEVQSTIAWRPSAARAMEPPAVPVPIFNSMRPKFVAAPTIVARWHIATYESHMPASARMRGEEALDKQLPWEWPW